MAYEIWKVERDEAGKYRVNVKISPEESITLKFQNFPSEANIQSIAEQAVTNRVAEEEARRVAEEARLEAERKALEPVQEP